MTNFVVGNYTLPMSGSQARRFLHSFICHRLARRHMSALPHYTR